MNSIRIEEIQKTTAYPCSRSVREALLQVWNECEQDLANHIVEVREIIKKHTEKLNTIKANRAQWEEERWTDGQIKECNRMIEILDSKLIDLNHALNHKIV